jgi:hypothetical protein
MQAGLYQSLPEAVSAAFKLNGIAAFYVGYGATLMREVNRSVSLLSASSDSLLIDSVSNL